MFNSKIMLSVILVSSLFSLSLFVSAFAENLPSPYAITVKTDLGSYKLGDTIIITGHVRDLQIGTPITIAIYNPSQKIVLFDQIATSSDGSFTTTFVPKLPLWSDSGSYTIRVTYGQTTANDISFNYQGTTPILPAPSSPFTSANSTSNFTSPTTPSTPSKIPNWVKAIFGYYAQGNLSDDDLIKALQFLIKQGIIRVS